MPVQLRVPLPCRRTAPDFADFVAAMANAKPDEKTPAQVAEETVAAKLKERDTAAEAARKEAEKQAFEQQQQRTRDSFVQQAEAGTQEDPNRWEMTALAGAAGQAWDVIWGHYQATAKFDANGNVIAEGEKLTREQALDYLESKLKEKQNARRAKQTPAASTAGAQNTERNEAAGAQTTDGRAAAPSFTNRATSGVPAAVGTTPVEDRLDLPDHIRLARAAARAGIRLP
ncbi:MAG: hypothetical protein LC640_09205 [Frankia sp.]|nr:hypothetical protein [Frankia sp.]